MDDEPTSIQISKGLWKELNGRKEPGDTFEDVIWRMAGEDRDEPPTPDTSTRPEPEPRHDKPTPTREREQLRDALAGEDDLLEARVDAVLAMRDVLRERGRATKDDLLAVVDPDVVDYADPESVWSNMAKGTFSQLDGVESPSPGKSEWRWLGEDG